MNCSPLPKPASASPIVAEVEGLEIEDDNPGRSNSELVPLWLEELLYQAQGLPSQDVANTLKTVLKDQTFVDCSLPYQSPLI